MKKAILKIASAALCIAMALSFAGCKGKEKDVYNVGICQLVTHGALDKATDGFKQALIDKLGKDKVKFDYQNAANDSNACATIVNSFVQKKYDLIMANATPALQAAYNATSTIPILGTSVTEYGVALGIDGFDGTVGGNVSGTSDLAPLDKQADMITELFPNAKKVGILYCSAEPNSKYQVEQVEKFLKAKNIEVSRYSFSDSNDIASVTTTAASNSDVIYVPTDNTAASCTETIGNIVVEKKVPVIAGEASICRGCGVATLSIDYYDLGYKTGEMAAEILTGKKDIKNMKIEYVDAKKQYNKTICDKLGITVPSDYSVLGEE